MTIGVVPERGETWILGEGGSGPSDPQNRNSFKSEPGPEEIMSRLQVLEALRAARREWLDKPDDTVRVKAYGLIAIKAVGLRLGFSESELRAGRK